MPHRQAAYESRKVLHQVVYSSRASQYFTESELVALCEDASERNRQYGVTGLLLYDGYRFLQALEGPETAVRKIMQSIEADSRHQQILYLADQKTDRRRFGEWSMSFKTVPSGCCSEAFLERVKSDVATIQDDDIRAVFIGFAMLGSNAQSGYRCTTN